MSSPKDAMRCTSGAKRSFAVGLTELLEYFERRKQQCEAELRHTGTPGFRMVEITPQGEVDITEQHRAKLVKARDGYQRAIESLKMQDRDP